MWQKSDTGSVPGISGNVDLDECYQDYPTLIQNAGLNGFMKSETVKLDEMPELDTKQEKYFSVSVDGRTYSGTLVEE